MEERSEGAGRVWHDGCALCQGGRGGGLAPKICVLRTIQNNKKSTTMETTTSTRQNKQQQDQQQSQQTTTATTPARRTAAPAAISCRSTDSGGSGSNSGSTAQHDWGNCKGCTGSAKNNEFQHRRRARDNCPMPCVTMETLPPAVEVAATVGPESGHDAVSQRCALARTDPQPPTERRAFPGNRLKEPLVA